MPAKLVSNKTLGKLQSPRIRLLNECAQPDAELENPLELFVPIVPAIIVADVVGGQEVIRGSLAPRRVGEHMVRGPGALDLATADVAS